MTALYEGTRNKLDYVCTKMRNILSDFWYENILNQRFAPNAHAAASLEDEIDIVERIAHGGYLSRGEWELVLKYTVLADEFRAMKATK